VVRHIEIIGTTARNMSFSHHIFHTIVRRWMA